MFLMSFSLVSIFFVLEEKLSLIFFFSNQVCELGVKGISMLVDGTPRGFKDIRDTLQQQGVPYFSFDYSIQSAVMMLEAYLRARQALDAVIILQDEVAADEALHAFIARSSLRVMLLDQLSPSVVESLRTLRPAPNYFAIVADAVNMRRLFQIVSRNPDGTANG